MTECADKIAYGTRQQAERVAVPRRQAGQRVRVSACMTCRNWHVVRDVAAGANLCPCGQGEASSYDGKCGGCRTSIERKILARVQSGWPRAAALRGYLTAEEKAALPTAGRE